MRTVQDSLANGEPFTDRDVLHLPLVPNSPGFGVAKTLFTTGSTDAPYLSVSPDGRWIAYPSNTSGNRGVSIRQLHEDGSAGPEVVVAIGTIWRPTWSKNSKASHMDLFYQAEPEHQLMAVSITTEPNLTISEPRQVFDLREHRLGSLGGNYLLPDGRFIAVQYEEEEQEEVAPRINVLLGFDRN